MLNYHFIFEDHQNGVGGLLKNRGLIFSILNFFSMPVALIWRKGKKV